MHPRQQDGIKKEKEMKKTYLILAAAACFGLSSQVAMAEVNVEGIYKSKCKMCHKFDKKKVGPAFKDMNKDPAALKEAIANGRKMMPKFKKKLSVEEIDAMVVFVQSKQAKANPCAANNPCAAKKPCAK
ncbi:MAG: cytochrome c [Mariprofundus sp.]|nr:cytochrome c [Mariprofundus sp.]